MIVQSLQELIQNLEGIAVSKEGVEVKDLQTFRDKGIDVLIYNAVLNESQEIRKCSCWIIWELALKSGIVPSSIHELYEAWGKGDYPADGVTVPAVNLRGLTYTAARALVRAVLKNNTGPFIFEIARSEIGYTDQSPEEYVSVCLAACIKEGYKGPCRFSLTGHAGLEFDP